MFDGTRLTAANDLVPTCSQCGAHYPTDTKFCINDGTKLELATYTGASVFDNIHGYYTKASLARRFAASLLDSLVTTGLSLPSVIVLYNALVHMYRQNFTDYLFFAAILYLLPLTYSLIKDGLGKGQSMGKRIADIMVVNLGTNTPCSKWKSAFRCFISALIFVIPYVMVIATRSGATMFVLFLILLIEPIMVLARADGRKIADLATDTMVIDVENFHV
jgi:uncharacterized RDD family membrane protein YckC